jgi:hypothetical protein
MVIAKAPEIVYRPTLETQKRKSWLYHIIPTDALPEIEEGPIEDQVLIKTVCGIGLSAHKLSSANLSEIHARDVCRRCFRGFRLSEL